MREIKVETWGELNAHLWDQSADARDESGNWRIPYTAFRGVPQQYGNLQTSLKRFGGDVRRLEGRFIDNFRRYAREDLRHGDSDWHVLALGQHHRLPTRLLCWTTSPLAAMFFASAKDPDQDGEIWCVSRLKTDSALSPVFAELKNTNLFSIEVLSEKYRTMDKFDAAELATGQRSLLFFDPPSISPRIVNQFAFFSVMPDPCYDTDEWLEAHANWCWKVVVPKGLKREICDRLMVMNVSDRTLFPGLDGTSKFLRAWNWGRDLP